LSQAKPYNVSMQCSAGEVKRARRDDTMLTFGGSGDGGAKKTVSKPIA